MKDRERHTGSSVIKRSYSLVGPETKKAVEAGFHNAEWYRAPIDPDRLRVLMLRRNGRPAVDAIVWLALLCGAGTAAFLALGTWWAIPAFAVFGALWGGSADARWHENGHGTAFKSRWANDVMYYVASFMMIREPTFWRWLHVRHHSDTMIVGLDLIEPPRPPSMVNIAINYLNLINGPKALGKMVMHAFGHREDLTRVLVPDKEFRRVAWEARIFLLLLLGALAVVIARGTIVPLLFVGLPSFYGAWLWWFFAITQHAGLREDVLDHRMNTRTVYINPVFSFLYLNMNYHVEHHMFPAVPYYNLPALHEEIKAYLPPPKTSMLAAYREIFHALWIQRRDVTWEIPTDWVAPDETKGADSGATLRITTATGSNEVDLGQISLAPGQLVAVEVDGSSYLLCRILDGTYAFIDGVCTHGRTPLSGGFLDDCIIECPKHNGRFDVRTGAAVRHPAQKPLRTYQVNEHEGRLTVDMRPSKEAWPAIGPGRPVGRAG
jgi:fatty acid desaturase/nitrite reductase/ring-hydroxylating ferredoxin subunit